MKRIFAMKFVKVDNNKMKDCLFTDTANCSVSVNSKQPARILLY